MRTIWKIPLLLGWILVCGQASGAYSTLQFQQELTTHNLQSRRGVPISTVAGNPSGSDGRMCPTNDSFGSYSTPTACQFRNFISFGAVPGLNSNAWWTMRTSPLLQGTTPFSASVAEAMKLPVAKSNTTVVMVMRHAQVGAPYFIRASAFAFGSLVSVPKTDERGVLLSIVPEQYWLAEPYSTSHHTNDPFYWSPNARAVFAIQSGPMIVTWRKATPYTAGTVPLNYVNALGTASFETNVNSIYLLYTVNYVVSGSAVKPPRKIYWTEGDYAALGKPVTVPAGRVGGLTFVYNNNFPEMVNSNEVVLPSGTPFVHGIHDRTLWYDAVNKQIRAFNRQGRVFMELLGDPSSDQQTRAFLGFEIIDVLKQPTPADMTIELGEQLTPPLPGILDELSPQPIVGAPEPSFAYRHSVAGSDRIELYAAYRTANLNDYMVHWMEEGLQGLKWPALFARYQLVWPDAIEKYSLYIRPAAATEEEAKVTAVAMAADNVPFIACQDILEFPRAKLTEQFKFYTWLDDKHPAHRTLLRFTTGESVAFERVFSWFDANLKATNFVGSVAEELSSWDPTNHVFNWPEPLKVPRLVSQTVNVGERISAPADEPGNGGDYLAGHINQSAGTSFDPHAYVDPLADGFEAANQGAIIPVNAIPGENQLEVWWFRRNTLKAGPHTGDATLGFKTIYWPSVLGRYTLQWPANAPEIVLASKLGSGTLDTFQAQGSIYYQNNDALPGYNPNEEHALMAAGTAYATRDDLNHTNANNYSSQPFVLVEYRAADGRPAITAFKVLREKPEAGYVFDYLVPAGQMLQGPMPLPLLGKPVVGSGDYAVSYNQEPSGDGGDLPTGWDEDLDAAGPYGYYSKFTYQDRHNDFWVYRGLHAGLPPLQAGTYDPASKTFTSTLTPATAVVAKPFSYFIHASRQQEYLALSPGSAWPDWLSNSISGLSLHLDGVSAPPAGEAGKSYSNLKLIVTDLYDGSSVTNTLPTLTVLGSGSVVAQGRSVITCTNSYTGSVVDFSNRPPFLAASPAPSNTFTMRFYYKTEPSFAWPGIDPPPAGSIVPYLRRYDRDSQSFPDGDGASPYTPALDIVYRPFWPVRDPKDSSKPVPTLAYGASLTLPTLGLPGVRDMKTAFVLYQQSIATNIAAAEVAVVLHDPTRAKYSDLAAHALNALPASVRADYYQGRYYFPNLPPHLTTRLYLDPNRGTNGSLVLKGEFKQEIVGESYLMLNVLRGTDLESALALCPTNDADAYPKWTALVNDLATDVETFYEDPTVPGAYIPDQIATVNVGVTNLASVLNDNTAVDSYALSATGPGGGYVTLLESSGTAFTQPGDPVAMHIFKVGGSVHRGELKVIPAANPLSEQVTFQHTADLAGRFNDYEYEWKIAPPVDGQPPVTDADMTNYLALISPNLQTDLPRYTLGGAGIQALGDNYVVMRYRPKDVLHPLVDVWSEWTKPALAEGWIKRVLAGINPFNQRVTDLFNNLVNTDASILAQAGHRWEGDIALNMDTINNYGLIEIYETILRRGRSLSIESGYNYGPANDALLLAAGYLNDLYMMGGNEAWADASNPTIGIGTADRTYGDIATALFAFKGQMPSLLEEELALLRGRDDFLQPGVEVAPAYNRLMWNYTRGIDAGEVIYALNYNILEQDGDGVVGAADAAKLYPQGHGDAYGHYLTALKGYYSLLLNSCFDWVPRTEAVNVLGQPVQVDYQDERKFAAAAAAVARAGYQVLDLTWRKDYQPVQSVGWAHFEATRVNSQRSVPSKRHWGMDHWACRAGQGAYLNWVVGNAILPEVDPNPNHEGIQKVDRTTVPELQELVTLAQQLQTDLNNAEGGLSPLGLPQNGLAFDVNPSQVVGTENGTHFEQIYQRAKVALNNAVAAFDDAKDVTRLMRSEQDSLANYQATVDLQERAYNNSLIEIYGTPYPDDMGPGKTYSQDYTGPDLIHYAYVELPESGFNGLMTPAETQTTWVDIQQLPDDWSERFYTDMDWVVSGSSEDYLNGTHYLEFVIGPHGFFDKPPQWTGRRASPGQIQQAISQLIAAHTRLRMTLIDAEYSKYVLDSSLRYFSADVDTRNALRGYEAANLALQEAVAAADLGFRIYDVIDEHTELVLDNAKTFAVNSIPQSLIMGLASGGDLASAARASVVAGMNGVKEVTDWLKIAKFIAKDVFSAATATAMRWDQFSGVAPLQWEQQLRNTVNGLGGQLANNWDNLVAINERLRELDDAQRAYAAAVANGERLQQERQTYRKRVAAVIQGYRTRDAAFRIFRNEKLERYKTLFDLAARYSLLAANAYDYETGLLNTEAGRAFVNRIINSRALGVVRNGEPQYAGSNTGDPGLSSALAEMKADWDVLRGRLGFNNPDAYGTTVSLRTECLRILPTSDGDASWKDMLHLAQVDNLLADSDVRRYCMQIDNGDGLPVPGIILTFSTTIAEGLNLFGRQLAAGDHAFSSSSFATKIFGVGIALEGYRGMADPDSTSPPDPPDWYLDPLALSATPYIYLVPVGVDSMRSPPLGDAGTIRTWSVADVAIPMPFNIGASDLSTLQLWQSGDSLTEPLFAIRKHQAFRPVPDSSFFSPDLYGSSGTLQRSQFTNNRLVGRSVWNSRWKLVIPGRSLLYDPNEGLDRFLQTVNDIKLHFVTYSYSGN